MRKKEEIKKIEISYWGSKGNFFVQIDRYTDKRGYGEVIKVKTLEDIKDLENKFNTKARRV